MSTRSSVAVILICGFTALLLAQAPPQPGPEHKKLEYFLGTWKAEDEIKPTSMCRPVRVSPPKHIHWGREDSMSSAALKGNTEYLRHHCLRQLCEGLHNLLREQRRTRGDRHRIN